MRNVSLIVAYDRERGIGKDNRMPWHLPSELAHFKRTTMGKPIVMGRKTHESIGRVLPGRRNIVVTRGTVATQGVETARSIQDALALCADAEEVMVIGGGQIYAAALPFATRVVATEIDADFAADTHFPALDAQAWREAKREHFAPDQKTPYALDIVTYERIGG